VGIFEADSISLFMHGVSKPITQME
jgi:hypothetical protein